MNLLKSCCIFAVLFSCFSLGQNKDNSPASVDGPYIFYRKNNIEVKQIIPNSNQLIAKKQSFPITNNEIFQCFIDYKKSFTFKLKDSLKNEPTIYKQPKKMMVISDIEGNFHQFSQFLIQNKIIDKNFNWTFGKGHLVLNGDFMDRGLAVTQCLWLIYKMENDAEKKGGKVHFILGNHEIMNLYGNTKYVRNQYFENAKMMNEKYQNLFTPETELGRWLVTKNVVERVGKYLFIHAGFSPELLQLNLSLTEINEKSRPHYFNAYEIRKSKDKNLQILFSGSLSPFWYRAIARKNIPEKDIDTILEKYEAKKMIIGHTLVPEISYLYNQKVINVDTHHAEEKTQGFLIQGKKEFRVDINGKRTRMN